MNLVHWCTLKCFIYVSGLFIQRSVIELERVLLYVSALYTNLGANAPIPVPSFGKAGTTPGKYSDTRRKLCWAVRPFIALTITRTVTVHHDTTHITATHCTTERRTRTGTWVSVGDWGMAV